MIRSKWTDVPSDIPVKEDAQMAISSDADQIAIIENSVLTVRMQQVPYEGQDDETSNWDVLDTIHVVVDTIHVAADGGCVLSASASLSSAEYVVHATMLSSSRGLVLSIIRDFVGTKDTGSGNGNVFVGLSEILGFDESNDLVKVALSGVRGTLTGCTREDLRVLKARRKALLSWCLADAAFGGSHQ
jgi:hypothetical protein